MTGTRFNRTDWLKFGLKQLAEQGPDALKLAELCAAAERTTGSFYYHFDDHGAFIDAIIQRWRKFHTEDVISELDGVSEPKDQAEALNTLATSLDQKVEIGIRMLAQQSKRTADAVMEVDDLRLDYVAKIYQDRFDIDPDTSRSLAELEYAAFVGCQMVWKGTNLEHSAELAELFTKMAEGYLRPRPDYKLNL